MQVILLQDVEKVGLRGDVVDVARGYARNYLVPRRLAEEATPARVAELEKRDSLRARHEAATVEQAREIAAVLEHAELRFEMKAGPTGSLFGSVTPTNIADALWEEKKVRIDRRRIDLGQPIKQVGRYAVAIDIFEDVRVEVQTLVVPEGGELPEPEPVAATVAEPEAVEPEAAVEEPVAEPEPPAEEPAAEPADAVVEAPADEPAEA
jgi:large subunit ribosomal protein L9